MRHHAQSHMVQVTQPRPPGTQRVAGVPRLQSSANPVTAPLILTDDSPSDASPLSKTILLRKSFAQLSTHLKEEAQANRRASVQNALMQQQQELKQQPASSPLTTSRDSVPATDADRGTASQRSSGQKSAAFPTVPTQVRHPPRINFQSPSSVSPPHQQQPSYANNWHTRQSNQSTSSPRYSPASTVPEQPRYLRTAFPGEGTLNQTVRGTQAVSSLQLSALFKACCSLRDLQALVRNHRGPLLHNSVVLSAALSTLAKLPLTVTNSTRVNPSQIRRASSSDPGIHISSKANSRRHMDTSSSDASSSDTNSNGGVFSHSASPPSDADVSSEFPHSLSSPPLAEGISPQSLSLSLAEELTSMLISITQPPSPGQAVHSTNSSTFHTDRTSVRELCSAIWALAKLDQNIAQSTAQVKSLLHSQLTRTATRLLATNKTLDDLGSSNSRRSSSGAHNSRLQATVSTVIPTTSSIAHGSSESDSGANSDAGTGSDTSNNGSSVSSHTRTTPHSTKVPADSSLRILVLALSDSLLAQPVAALHRARPQSLTNGLWGLAVLNCTRTPAFSLLMSASLRAMPTFNAQDIANCCWAVACKNSVYEDGTRSVDSGTSGFGSSGEGDESDAWVADLEGHSLHQPGSSTERTALVAAAAVRAMDVIDDFTPQGMSNTLWGCACHRVVHPPFLEAACRYLAYDPPALGHRAFSLSLWAFATLKHVDLPLLQAIARSAHALRMETFDFQSLSNTAWSFATMVKCVADSTTAVADGYAAATDILVTTKSDGMSATADGSTAILQTLKIRKSKYSGSSSANSSSDSSGSDSSSDGSSSGNGSSSSSSGSWPTHRASSRSDAAYLADVLTTAQTVLRSAIPILVERVPFLIPAQQLANLMWAYGTCGVYEAQLFNVLSQQCEASIRAGQLLERDLSSISWSMSKTRHYHPGLLHLMAHHPEMWHRNECNSQDMSNILWAVARLYRDGDQSISNNSGSSSGGSNTPLSPTYLPVLATFAPLISQLCTASVDVLDNNTSGGNTSSVDSSGRRVTSSGITVGSSSWGKSLGLDTQSIGVLAWSVAILSPTHPLLTQLLHMAGLRSNDILEGKFLTRDLRWMHQLFQADLALCYTPAGAATAAGSSGDSCADGKQEAVVGGVLERHHPELYAACASSWREGAKFTSDSSLCRQVFDTALAMGLNPRSEVLAGDGLFSVDCVVEWRGTSVLLEVDGPLHFSANRPRDCITGETLLRQRLTARMLLTMPSTAPPAPPQPTTHTPVFPAKTSTRGRRNLFARNQNDSGDSPKSERDSASLDLDSDLTLDLLRAATVVAVAGAVKATGGDGSSESRGAVARVGMTSVPFFEWNENLFAERSDYLARKLDAAIGWSEKQEVNT